MKLRLPPDVADDLDELATRWGVTRSGAVARLVEEATEYGSEADVDRLFSALEEREGALPSESDAKQDCKISDHMPPYPYFEGIGTQIKALTEERDGARAEVERLRARIDVFGVALQIIANDRESSAYAKQIATDALIASPSEPVGYPDASGPRGLTSPPHKLATPDEPRPSEAWAALPVGLYITNGGRQCDMAIGACSCGATHTADEHRPKRRTTEARFCQACGVEAGVPPYDARLSADGTCFYPAPCKGRQLEKQAVADAERAQAVADVVDRAREFAVRNVTNGCAGAEFGRLFTALQRLDSLPGDVRPSEPSKGDP